MKREHAHGQTNQAKHSQRPDLRKQLSSGSAAEQRRPHSRERVRDGQPLRGVPEESRKDLNRVEHTA